MINMKTYTFVLIFIMIFCDLAGQQVVNIVLDPSAFAIRGAAIPGMLATATTQKNEQANVLIPDIIREERSLIRKWRSSVIGNVNSLNALAIESRILIDMIDIKRALILPAHYAPGYRKQLRRFLRLKERAERLEIRVATLVGIGAFFIDGEGYYRVASQRLAIEYLTIYSELSEIDFNLSKLLAFIGMLPLLTK